MLTNSWSHLIPIAGRSNNVRSTFLLACINWHSRHHPAAAPRRRLVRSKSGSTAATTPSPWLPPQNERKHSFTSWSTKKKEKEEEEAITTAGGLVGFLPRKVSVYSSKIDHRRPSANSNSSITSPSAWALSPGRFDDQKYYNLMKVQQLATSKGDAGGGGVSLSFLKHYLRTVQKKKVSPLLEEEYHHFRLLYNTLLQWRFANARAEASTAALNTLAQEKVLNVWVRISVMRKLMVEKQSQVQKLKQEMKLYQILKPEMGLLNEWRRIETKNVEALGRVVRKLSAISLCLPLVHNAQADIMSVYEAISTAMDAMDNIKAMIMDMNWQSCQ